MQQIRNTELKMISIRTQRVPVAALLAALLFGNVAIGDFAKLRKVLTQGLVRGDLIQSAHKQAIGLLRRHSGNRRHHALLLRLRDGLMEGRPSKQKNRIRKTSKGETKHQKPPEMQSEIQPNVDKRQPN